MNKSHKNSSFHRFLFNAVQHNATNHTLTHLAVDMEAFARFPVKDAPRVPQFAWFQKGDKLQWTLHSLQHDCEVVLNMYPELTVWPPSPLQNAKWKYLLCLLIWKLKKKLEERLWNTLKSWGTEQNFSVKDGLILNYEGSALKTTLLSWNVSPISRKLIILKVHWLCISKPQKAILKLLVTS